jgi:hypothetical protein
MCSRDSVSAVASADKGSRFVTNAELRALLRTDKQAFIVAVARNFPSIVEAGIELDPWRPMELRHQAFGRGERLRAIVQFVLGLWTFHAPWADRDRDRWPTVGVTWDEPELVADWLRQTGRTVDTLGYDPFVIKLDRFNPLVALQLWAEGDRAAFLEWAKDPIYPALEAPTDKHEDGENTVTRKRQPTQPLVVDDEGAVRFQANEVVRQLLELARNAGVTDLSRLRDLPGIAVGDWEQFTQLIGYTLAGFGELSFVRKSTWKRVATRAEKLAVPR